MSGNIENFMRHREAKVTWLEHACPVVIFDDAIPNLEELRGFAFEEADFRPVPAGIGFYPGLKAKLTPRFETAVAPIWTWLSETLWRDVFQIDPTSLFKPYFDFDHSLVGPPPDIRLYSPTRDAEILDIHVDSHSVFTAVGYLNVDSERTGTKFWRNKVTGSVASWIGDYRGLLDVEKVFGLRLFDKWRDAFACKTPQSLVACTAQLASASRRDRYEEVLHVAAKPGRIIAYPTWLSHSIGYADYEPPQTRRNARITINKFFPWPTRPNDWALEGSADVVNPAKG